MNNAPLAVENIFTGTDWGFGASDIWTQGMGIVASVSGFLVLGIVIAFAPRIFGLLRKAIIGNGGSK